MALPWLFQLAVPEAGDTEFRVGAVRGREALHAPFSFDVACAAMERGSHRSAAVDPLSWIGAEVSLSWPLGEGGERRIVAVIDAVEASPPSCRLTLVPRLVAVMDATDHRVFIDRDAVEIAREVLDEHGIALEARLAATPHKRPQRIQGFEGDLAFVSRLLADEGIAYRLSEDGTAVVLADGPAGYDDLGLLLPFREEAGLEAGEAVYAARLTRRAVVEEVALRDYDFERPMLDLTARAGDGGRGLTRFEYPGGHRDPGEGRALAAARLGELGARRLVLRGETGVRSLRAGVVVDLGGGPRGDMNGRWLVVEVEHEGRELEGGAPLYRARFTAIPFAVSFRPPRSRAPRFAGVQTAIVTGPRGAEIHTEQHGRVRVSHRWDRRSPGDDRSSAWARTAQPATSGSIFLPRVGWEALVGFAGTGDEPVVLGRLDNGQSPPAESLPAGKVKSALATRTTPGGGGSNGIGTDDTAGAERLSSSASKDWSERTENDKVTAIEANDLWNIGAASFLRVGAVFRQAVTGAQALVTAGHRSVNVGANLTYSASSDAVIIGGMRLITTGGDHATQSAVFTRFVVGAEAQLPVEHQTRFVGGGSLVLNAGGWLTSAGGSAGFAVGGAAALHVGGVMLIEGAQYALNVKGFLSEKYASRTVTAGGSVAETFRGSGTYEIKGDARLAGSEVVVEARAKLTLKAGGVVVEMTPGGITVRGQFKGQCSSVQGKNTSYG
ncbi:type VI secretion system tip protein TssI/VgrG [Sorangium sp. So ce136]|uniref:type VI secretion system Vgr family protein n=1 Tax=Sorangium sp. So ce136 TaxID=3133284 RepID=UPI003EFC49B7